MAERLGEAVLELSTEDRELMRGVRRALTGARQMESQWKKVAAVVGGAFGGALVIRGIRSFVRSLADAAITTENLRLRLDALLGSTDEGAKAFARMRDFASTVPFEFQEIMNSAAQLAGIVKGGADEIAGLMPIIADLAAVFDLTIQQTTEQIVRSFSAGIGSADLFRERGITAMLGFQAGATVSAEETRRRIVAAWLDQESKFRGASQRMAGTWTGLMSMFSDAWFAMRTAILESPFLAPILDKVKIFLRDFIAILRGSTADIKEAFELIGIVAANALALGLSESLVKLRAVFGVLAPVFEKLMDDAAEQALQNIREAATAFDALALRLGAGVQPAPPTPLGVGGPAMGAPFGHLLALGDHLRRMGRVFADTSDRTKKLQTDFNALGQLLGTGFSDAIVGAIFGLNSFTQALLSVISQVAQQALGSFITSLIPIPGLRLASAPRAALAGGGSMNVRLSVEGDNLQGAALDAGIYASNPQLQRFLIASLQTARFGGFRG